MAGLRVAITALALLAAAPADAQSVVHWRPYIEAASARFGVPVEWIERVMRAESGGRTVLDGRPITSHAGAMGLMQLMPGTWARQRGRYSLGSDPFDPRDNILAGTSYLREMYDRYGVAGFLAAYNAGPGRYESWFAGRRSLPLETRRYVAKIAPLLQPGRIFVTTPSHPTGAPGAPDEPVSTSDYAPGDLGLPKASGEVFARPVQPAHDLFAPSLRSPTSDSQARIPAFCVAR